MPTPAGSHVLDRLCFVELQNGDMRFKFVTSIMVVVATAVVSKVLDTKLFKHFSLKQYLTI